MPFGTFNLITPDDLTHRKALPLTDPDLLDPSHADCLEQGEWVVPSAAGYLRYAAVAPGPAVAYPKASPKGSTDEQAISKMESYFSGNWSAWTTTYDPGGSYAIGTPLTIYTIDIGGGVMRSVLTDAAVGDQVHAEVIEPPANAANFDQMLIRKVRFVRHA